jgi:Cu/Ag efflux protein CusF
MTRNAMNRLSRIVIALASAVAIPTAACAQGTAVTTIKSKGPDSRMAAGEVQIRAKVVELDMAHRLATLKGPKGNLVTLEVPAEVKNFDQMRVGDEVVVRYIAAVAARLEPASKSGIRERVESTTAASAAPGALPAAGAQRTVQVLAVIQAVDRNAGTVTLRGAKRTVTIAVPEGVDIRKLKVGDEVRAEFTEAIVLNVERVSAAK